MPRRSLGAVSIAVATACASVTLLACSDPSVETAIPQKVTLNGVAVPNVDLVDDAVWFDLLTPAIPQMTLLTVFASVPTGPDELRRVSGEAHLIYQDAQGTLLIIQRSIDISPSGREIEDTEEIGSAQVSFAKSGDEVSRVAAFTACGTHIEAHGALEAWPQSRLSEVVPYFTLYCE